MISANQQNIVRHAYFREYRALQRLCLFILQHQKHQIGSGMRQIYGILFDGAWLWEEYVNTLICDLFYHPMNKGGKGAQRLFDGNTGLIYPDFIGRNSEKRMIADAKYKPLGNIGIEITCNCWPICFDSVLKKAFTFIRKRTEKRI